MPWLSHLKMRTLIFAFLSLHELRCWWRILFNVKNNYFLLSYQNTSSGLHDNSLLIMLKGICQLLVLGRLLIVLLITKKKKNVWLGLWLYCCLQGFLKLLSKGSLGTGTPLCLSYASRCIHKYSPKHGQPSRFKPVSFLTNPASMSCSWPLCRHLCH